MIFASVYYVRDLVRRYVSWWNNSARSLLYGAKYAAKRVAICAGLVVVVVWVSVLLYASFYHVYVPSASILRPAHFKFRVCPSGSGMCSFPMANVTLGPGHRAEVLGRGQLYRVFLVLQVPDSKPNRDVGMFMVIGRVYDRYGVITQEASRAVSLRYQSDLLKVIQTVTFSPFYITGFSEEMQTLSIELFEEFWDDFYQPTVGMLLEIHSRHLSFYSAQLQFHASYVGLRYYLFYYPLSCAFLGILFNCLWVTVAFTLTWYKLGLELLDGTQVKAVTSKDEASGERAGEQEVCPTEAKDPVETVGELGPAEEEKEERALTPPISYIQPFTMTVSPVHTETVGGRSKAAGGREDAGSPRSGGQLRQRAKVDSPS